MSNNQDLAAAMKAGMRHLASGVAVVATRDTDGHRYAMTVTSITSISDEPPSLLVSLHRDASTCRALATSDCFSANVLQRSQQAVSDRCAFLPGDEDRFAEGEWRDAGEARIPYLSDALASFICRVKRKVDYGTHCIVIADIERVFTHETPGQPLVYLRGGYAALATDDDPSGNTEL